MKTFRFKTLLILLVAGLWIQPVESVEVTQEQIDAVGKELACLCGTCPRRPLDECTCGYAQQQNERIKSMLASGQSTQAVIDAYVSEFGKEVLSKPPAEGFNLAAWVMPPVVLIAGFFVVKSVLRTWSQSGPATQPASSVAQAESDPYLDRLENDLKERDT